MKVSVRGFEKKVEKGETVGYQGLDCLVNPLPNDKSLDWSKLKAFADDKINVT